jgi:hypothetical protein
MTVTPERTIFSVGGWPLHVTAIKLQAVSLLKRFHNGRFASETATWIQELFKKSAGTSSTENYVPWAQ